MRRCTLGSTAPWKGISWGVGYYYTRASGQQKNDRSWSFNINIPLGGPLSDSAVSYNTTSDSNGYTSQQMSLYGAVPTRPNLFYSVPARLWQTRDEAATAAPPWTTTAASATPRSAIAMTPPATS